MIGADSWCWENLEELSSNLIILFLTAHLRHNSQNCANKGKLLRHAHRLLDRVKRRVGLLPTRWPAELDQMAIGLVG